MANKNFGVGNLDVIGSGSPKIESSSELQIKAPNVAISTNFSVGDSLTVDGNTGVITATTFSGSASGLSNIPAGNLTGTVSDSRLNQVSASKLTGTINNDRLPSDINVGNHFSVIEKGEWYMPVGYARTMTAQVGSGITGTGASKAIGVGATRDTDAAIYDHCWDNYELWDVDGDGIVSPNDTMIITRYFTTTYDSGILDDIIFPYNATRTDHTAIRQHLSKSHFKLNGGTSYTSGSTTLSGISTMDGRWRLGVGAGVTGTGIPAGTTVTGIGTTTITVSQAVTQTGTGVTVYFGNNFLDLDGDGSTQMLLEGLIFPRIFGSLGNNPLPATVEELTNHDPDTDSFLNPNDGGGARFRSVGSVVGVGTSTPSTSNLQKIELSSGVYLNGSSFGKVVSVGSTEISQLSKLSTSNNWDISLGISTTVPNPESGYCNPGQSGFISVAQTAGGGKVLSWGSYWDFADGIAPTLSTGANDVNVIGYYVRSNTSIVADTITDIG
jgi:hypothetical protein